MSNKAPISFKKYRNFTELFLSTFGFIRQEFYYLMKSLFILATPLLVLMGIVCGFFIVDTMDLTIETNISNISNLLLNIFIRYSIMIVIIYITQSLIVSICLGYITEYIHNGPKVPFQSVLAHVKAFLPKVILFHFIYNTILIAGFYLLVIPGFYFYSALILSPVILVLEDTNISTSFKRSYYFIKGYFWRTLGYYFLIGVFLALVLFIVLLPIFLLGYYITPENYLTTEGTFTTLFIILLSVTFVLTQILHTFYIIFNSFYFYSQYELKEAGSLKKNNEEPQHAV